MSPLPCTIKAIETAPSLATFELRRFDRALEEHLGRFGEILGGDVFKRARLCGSYSWIAYAAQSGLATHLGHPGQLTALGTTDRSGGRH